MATSAPGLTEQHDTVRFHETILQGLAKVMQEQLEFRQDVDTLKSRMVTVADVEHIITDRFMTRQEVAEQREKDMQTWRKSTRWFYGALSGCGCSVILGMFLTSLMSAGAIWGVTHFLIH